MKYLVIDGALNGTGIRDKVRGGYVEPLSLLLSDVTIKKIENWLFKYENEHYNDFQDTSNIDRLDKEGKEIAFIVKMELGNSSKIEYFSSGNMTSHLV